MMILSRFLCVWIAAFICAAATPPLHKRDIRPSMEEMFRYHIEFRQMHPVVMKRSFKLFIENFDRDKIYFLHSEVAAFLQPDQGMLSLATADYQRDQFSHYERLNEIVAQAIVRSRRLRQEIEKELIVNDADFENYFFKEPESQHAADLTALKARIRKQLVRFLLVDKRGDGETCWSAQRRQKVFALWEKRFQRLENPYLDAGEHPFSLHVLKALARSLDAHTAYFSPDEAFEMRLVLEREFEGIGVLLSEGVDGVYISGVMAGSPAEKSGRLQVNDFLVSINGAQVEEIGYEDVLSRLKTGDGKEIRLGLKRKAEAPFEVCLRREQIVMDEDRLRYTTVAYGDGLIVTLDLPSFYESGESSSCEQDIRRALKEIRSKGKILGVILDLRENSGGFLTQAVKVAGLFITSGVIVISKYADGQVQYLRNVDGRVYYDGPLLILTSKASASAAEIVAQVLQDYGIGLIVGDAHTYGKGSIQYQTITDGKAKAFFKVTAGKYYTVSGKTTQIDGVLADIEVPTHYAPYRIGERFLEYPLPRDQMPPAYRDSLADLDPSSQRWFQANYLPYLQQQKTFWRECLPVLQKNAAFRLSHDPNFQLFMHDVDPSKHPLQDASLKAGQWGQDDLQEQQAGDILRDMIYLEGSSR